MPERDTDGESEAAGPDLRPADCFAVLSHEHRLSVVMALEAQSGPVSLDELADGITDPERGLGVSRDAGGPHETVPDRAGQAITDGGEAVYRMLYHKHVPKLSDADVVAYDRDTDEVRPAQNFDVAARVVDSVAGDREPSVESGE